MTVIRIVCQYCHDEIGTKDGEGITGTSHGTCASCDGKTEAALKKIHAATLARERKAVAATKGRIA